MNVELADEIIEELAANKDKRVGDLMRELEEIAMGIKINAVFIAKNGNQAGLIPSSNFTDNIQARQMALGSSFIWDLHRDWERYLVSTPDPPDILTIVATHDGSDRQALPCEPIPPLSILPFYCAYESDDDPYDNMDGLVPVNSQNLVNIGVPVYYVPHTHGGDTVIAYVTSKDHKSYTPIVDFLTERIPETPPDDSVAEFGSSDERYYPLGNLLLELYNPDGVRVDVETVDWSDEGTRGENWGRNEESGLYFSSMAQPGTHTITINPDGVDDEPVTRRVEIGPGRTSVYRFVAEAADVSASVALSEGNTEAQSAGETGVAIAYSFGPDGTVDVYRINKAPSVTLMQALPYYWEIVTGMSTGSFSANVTFSYDEADVAARGLSEADPAIAACDNERQVLESAVNIENEEITVTVTAPSLFAIGAVVNTSSATEETKPAPASYELAQNYPNPFNPSTKISYTLPEPAEVRLIVFDVLGRQVCVLASGRRPAGTHEVVFDASNLPSGLYAYRLETDRYVETKHMMLVR